MRNRIILSIIICFLTVGLAGCSGRDDGKSNHSGSNSTNNGNNNNNSGHSTGGASGFSHKDVISALQNAGAISGEPTKADVAAIDGAMDGIIYNKNVLIITWEDYSDEAVFKKVDAHFKKGTIPYDGKDHAFYGWGSIALIFLDGNIDEKAVQAMRAL